MASLDSYWLRLLTQLDINSLAGLCGSLPRICFPTEAGSAASLGLAGLSLAVSLPVPSGPAEQEFATQHSSAGSCLALQWLKRDPDILMLETQEVSQASLASIYYVIATSPACFLARCPLLGTAARSEAPCQQWPRIGSAAWTAWRRSPSHRAGAGASIGTCHPGWTRPVMAALQRRLGVRKVVASDHSSGHLRFPNSNSQG